VPGRTLKSYCFRGGNLYRKERKKRLKLEPKSLIIEPANNSVDGKSMVEDDNVPARSDTILLPKRKLPELDFPDNLKYHIGYNCHLAHEKNTVSSIMYQLYICIYFFLCFTNFPTNTILVDSVTLSTQCSHVARKLSKVFSEKLFY